ncbi:hypothetical protein BOX15_Mlig024154g1, partial [Macrostomum lignano]
SDAISVQRRQSALVEDDNRTEADSGCPKADDPVSETVRADSEESCLVEGEELSSESRQQQFANPLFDSDSEGEDSGGLDEFDEEIRAAVAAAADQPAEAEACLPQKRPRRQPSKKSPQSLTPIQHNGLQLAQKSGAEANRSGCAEPRNRSIGCEPT